MPIGNENDIDLREVLYLDRAVRVLDERIRHDDLAGRRGEPEDRPRQPFHLDRPRLGRRRPRRQGQQRRHRSADCPPPPARHDAPLRSW